MSVKKSVIRRAGITASACVVALGGVFAAASPASAHATVQLYGSTPTAGGYGAMFIRIPHGCDGENTLTVKAHLPKAFPSAKPQMIAGWNSKVVTNSDGTRTVVWTSTAEGLPDDHFMDFGISVMWPAKARTYYVPVIQKCTTGVVRWNEKPGDSEPEHPAPSVMVEAASGGHGH